MKNPRDQAIINKINKVIGKLLKRKLTGLYKFMQKDPDLKETGFIHFNLANVADNIAGDIGEDRDAFIDAQIEYAVADFEGFDREYTCEEVCDALKVSYFELKTSRRNRAK